MTIQMNDANQVRTLGPVRVWQCVGEHYESVWVLAHDRKLALAAAEAISTRNEHVTVIERPRVRQLVSATIGVMPTPPLFDLTNPAMVATIEIDELALQDTEVEFSLSLRAIAAARRVAKDLRKLTPAYQKAMAILKRHSFLTGTHTPFLKVSNG